MTLGRTRTRGRSLAVPLAVTTVLASGSIAEAGAEPRRRLPEQQHISGSCLEGWFPIPVDAARVAPHVPAPFQPAVTVGKARVAVFAEECVLSRDGGPPVHAVFSGVPVPITPPPGESGNHSYDVLWATSSRTHYRWMRQLGSGSLIEGSVFEYADGPAATAFADVPGWFTFTMVGGDPPELETGFPLTTYHWQLGRFGPVRNAADHTEMRALPGHAVIRPEPGSPLADMIGEGPVQAEGLFFRFNFTQVSEVVQ
ncbi:MAG TPA: hypothetical protein VHL78_06235 [Actinomycetota bacterium]|nr:hypothetical protein [Actinomycetota bacterium]